MRFKHSEVNFEVTYGSHQNCLKKYFMNIFRGLSDHHHFQKIPVSSVNGETKTDTDKMCIEPNEICISLRVGIVKVLRHITGRERLIRTSQFEVPLNSKFL